MRAYEDMSSLIIDGARISKYIRDIYTRSAKEMSIKKKKNYIEKII